MKKEQTDSKDNFKFVPYQMSLWSEMPDAKNHKYYEKYFYF